MEKPQLYKEEEEVIQELRQGGAKELEYLFQDVQAFRDTQKAKELFDFMVRFPVLAPFNVMLVHAQRPGCRMVATAWKWKDDYGRRVKFTAVPLVTLRPFGPVEFVFDISDTEEIPGAKSKPIPDLAASPFQCTHHLPGDELAILLHNLPGQGIILNWSKMGAACGGNIRAFSNRDYFQYVIAGEGLVPVKAPYGMQLARDMEETTAFAILVHELGHLFCGHLGNARGDAKMPSRSDLGGKEPPEIKNIVEFEAECTAWLICRRKGVQVPAEYYLDGYLEKERTLPDIRMDLIFKAVSKIETLCKTRQPHRSDLVLSDKEYQSGLYTRWQEGA